MRPLGFGEILDVALKLAGRHWKVLAACVAIVVLPVVALSTAIVYSVDPSQYDLGTQRGLRTTFEESGTVGALFFTNLLQVLSYTLAGAACFKAVEDGYLGREPGVGRSLSFGLPRVPQLVGMYVVVSICVAIGFVLFIVPGVWLGTAWSLAVPALLFERIGVFAALRRSYELVKGRFWGVLGLLVVSILMVLVLSLLAGAIVGGIGAAIAADSHVAGALVNFVATAVSSMVTLPVLAAVLTVLYLDQRLRKERFEPRSEPPPEPVYSGWQPPVPPGS